MANSAEEPKAVKLWFDYANNDSRSVQVRRVVAGIEKQHYPQYLAFEVTPTSPPFNYVHYKKWNQELASLEERARIEWGPDTIAYLDTNETVSLGKLREKKKDRPNSRRFVVDGKTYKWKMAPESDSKDLRCLEDGGLIGSDTLIAGWVDQEKCAWLEPMSERLREQVVLALYLNLYYLSIGQW